MKLYVGLDWSRDSHTVKIFNQHQTSLAQMTIAHSRSGFEKLQQQLEAITADPADCHIAIETHHNQLVDFLWAQGYTLYIIAPSVVKGNRSRQSHAGAKTDERDAALLADILRTDAHRLLPWRPDSLPIRQMRTQISFLDDLTTDIVRQRNQLEAHLLRYFPQAVTLFSELTTHLALHFLVAFPSAAQASQLSYPEFEAFCRQHQDRRPKQIPKRFARLRQPHPFLDPDTDALCSSLTPQLAQRLLNNVQRKAALIKQLQVTFRAHPAHHIFDSLPSAGNILAPKLLTIFGDQPDRFPSPDIIRALAGTCPATSQSGKHRRVFFRKACNHHWRNTFQLFAKSSLSVSAWAASYFEAARLRGHSASHAYLWLANRWVGIIWTLWQRHTPYDEALHWQHLQRHKH